MSKVGIEAERESLDKKRKKDENGDNEHANKKKVWDRLSVTTSSSKDTLRGLRAGVIAVIARGHSGGETNSTRKSYADKPQTEDVRGKSPQTDESITFTDEDLEGILTPYDDLMIISLTIANYEVKRVLVDNGSSATSCSMMPLRK
ncbi:hypothetical protein DH2020_018931 [Rehmannia glutinosa]|uniref:Uncharacterized protein n=1 Tax=Rehmannia glutinosa TaxID=99300 RepID=A0ABR0WNV1_REHGL